MLFSSFHNQSKANELIERAKTVIQETKSRIEEVKERFVDTISKSDTIKEQLSQKSITQFQEIAHKLRNEPAVELIPISDTPFIDQVELLLQECDKEPPHIMQRKQKKGSAFIISLFTALITVAILFVVGAIGVGEPLNLETLKNPHTIETIFTWLGGGAFELPNANPTWGMIGTGLLALLVAFITWSLKLSKTAKQNLEYAESAITEAEAYEASTRQVIETMENLTNALIVYQKDIEICDAFICEFNATIRRILLTEGDDFTTLKPASQAVIERASATVTAVTPLLNIAILTTEAQTADQLQHAVEEVHILVEKLIEGQPIEVQVNHKSTESEPIESEPIILGYTHQEDHNEKVESHKEEKTDK
jgi:hypothetical protein